MYQRETMEHKRELQIRARDGDESACWELVSSVLPFAKVYVRNKVFDRSQHEDILQEITIALAKRASSGKRVDNWDAFGVVKTRDVVSRYARKEISRLRKESKYTPPPNSENDYSTLYACIEELDSELREIIQRMYFRPLRQRMTEYSKEFNQAYHIVVRKHRKALRELCKSLKEKMDKHA